MWIGLVVAAVLAWAFAAWAVAAGIRGPGLVRRLQALVVGLALACLALLLTGGMVLLRAFESFAGETLVARVRCHRTGPEAFALTYLPADAPPSSVRTISLRGDQWAITGGIIKWHRWLTAAGVPTYHRVLRLSGQFSDVARQRRELPTVEPLSSGSDLLWELLYEADPYLPFVEAVYGSAAFVYVEPGRVQEVYVTPSGYMIKRAPFAPLE